MHNDGHRAGSSRRIRLSVLAALALPGLVLAAVIDGTGADDTLTGTPDADILNGKAGIDTMMGLGGNDTYFVAQTDDEVIEGAGEGTDTIKSTVTYTLPIFVENLVLIGAAAINGTGNGLPNRMTGNSAKNALNGRGGADIMVGLGGDDTYFVSDATDEVIEAANGGIDTVISSVTYTLDANVENLQFSGSADVNGTGNNLINKITGNAGDNILIGGAATDMLIGGAGADQLIGGPGNDRLTGGVGKDVFRFVAPLSATTNIDEVVDFAPADDVMTLDGAVFPAFTVAGAISVGEFRRGAAAADSTDRIIYNPNTGAVLYDADGQGGTAAIQFATLAPGLAVSAADFSVQNPAGTPVIYTTQVQKIFTDNCQRCHSGSSAPHGLRLDAANSYANLVNVASSEVPSLLRVKPGDDANSYLVQKIEGTAAVGGRMPLNSTPLSAANINLIRRWIAEGASN